MRGSTQDFDSTGFYTVEALSENIRVRADGSIVCLNVPIARTGRMVYGPGETPVKIGGDGYAYVSRDEDDLIREETIASFAGVPVTDDHPSEDVTPENWRKYAVGTVTNPRAGVMPGDESVKLILADLIISDKKAIELVKSGKREVSCGYDADYEQTGEGQGRQSNIIGNHVALVEKGRCGPRCAIRDSEFQPQTKESIFMTQAKSALDTLRRFFRDAEPELEKLAGMGGESEKEVHIHFHGGADDMMEKPEGEVVQPEEPAKDEDPIEARFAALESQHQEILAAIAELREKLAGAQDQAPEDLEEKKVADEMDPEEEKEETKGAVPDEDMCGTKDSAALMTSWNKLLSDAEVLVPGFRMPTFDAKASRKSTVDNMCQLRRNAMSAAYMTGEGKALIDAVSGGVDFAKASCKDAAVIFAASVGAKRLQNNRAAVGDAKMYNADSQVSKSIGEKFRETHEKFWSSHK